jgi:hypothetical protein
LEVLVARDTCLEREDWMKRAIFLATAALLAMLILAPMALTQGTTFIDSGSPPPECSGCTGVAAGGGGFMGTTMVNGSPSPPLTPETGGSAILLPAAALLLGSGILTYAFLRRR